MILVSNQYITKYITEYPSNNEYNQHFQSRQNADKIMYCKLFRFKYDESRFDLNVQIDNFLNNKLLEDKRKLNELRAKDVSKPPLANIKHKNSKFLSK